MAGVVFVYENIERGFTAEIGDDFITAPNLSKLVLAIDDKYPEIIEVHYGQWFNGVFLKEFRICS